RSSVVYHDNNYSDRIGWKEVVLGSTGGAHLASSSAPSKSISERLLAYPKNLLQSPLDVTSARSVVVPGLAPAPPPTLLTGKELAGRAAVRAVSDGGFAKLIVHERLGAGF